MLVHPSITRWDRHGGLIYVIDSYPNDGSCDWWQALWPEPQQVLGALGIRLDMKVVDLCCGGGLFTAPLARWSGTSLPSTSIQT